MNTTNNYDDDDDDDDEIFDDQDEQVNVLEPVQSLFSTEIFPNVIEMFRSLKSEFNLTEFLHKHQIVSQYDYIRLINYIRCQKPTVEQLKQIESTPWLNEEYFRTIIENDPALQFDIEEDLNQLGDFEQSEQRIIPEDPLKQANERIRQLEEMVEMFKSMASRLFEDEKSNQTTTTEKKICALNVQDDGYFATYDHYEIHQEMLQDKIRSESYLNAIRNNVELFRDKIVLDVGCGTGILSMACVRYGQAKLVIAVDMSEIIYDAMAIAKENHIDESKIVFLHGRIEDVTLPVEKVDIIISEWMGYFLVFECMLESVIFARNHYLKDESGLVLPDDFALYLSAFHSEQLYNENVAYWSNVYGFEMNAVSKRILADGHVMFVPDEDLMTNDFCIKSLDIYNCSDVDITFTNTFSLEVQKSGFISAFLAYFDVNFKKNLIEQVHFSTSTRSPKTHWKQTVFFLPRLYPVQQDEVIDGKIVCQRHSHEKRAIIIYLHVFDSKFKFYLE